MPNREIAHGLVDYLQSDRTRLTFDEAEYLKDEIVTALDAAERRGLERAAQEVERPDEKQTLGSGNGFVVTTQVARNKHQLAAAIRALAVKHGC